MIASHFDLVKTRLESDPALAGKGADAVLINEDGLLTHATYWVLLGGSPDFTNERLAKPQSADDDSEFDYTFRFVSPEPAIVRRGMSKAIDLLAGWIPTLSGRRFSPVSVVPRDIEPDTTVRPPLFYADLTIRVKSSRA